MPEALHTPGVVTPPVLDRTPLGPPPLPAATSLSRLHSYSVGSASDSAYPSCDQVSSFFHLLVPVLWSFRLVGGQDPCWGTAAFFLGGGPVDTKQTSVL